MSNEKRAPSCLGEYTTQLCGDCNIHISRTGCYTAWVVPHPIIITNLSFGWDFPNLKMFHSPGGDWNPGSSGGSSNTY